MAAYGDAFYNECHGYDIDGNPIGDGEAERLAAEIVRAEMSDDWFRADMLRPQLRDANRCRRALGLKSIRATQDWYFRTHGVQS